MKELSKAYESQKYEDNIYKRWEESGFFNPDICVKKGVCDENAKSFSIVLPPPNVTGTLHIGHAMMLAIEDLMVRYHRMKGEKTLWLPGTDHAAIATQTKVEKLLTAEGVDNPRETLGRENFLEKVSEFAQKSHDTIVNQTKKMGSSLDWSREAFTLDDERNLAVRTVFKKMYDDELIYRGHRVVNWCPRCKSTLADDEVEHRTEKTAKLYWIKYGPFVLATTRPETKLGDTAVAVNPNDERYKDMVGKKYMIPGVLGEFEVEVVADDAVDMDFGSGAVKVTPYHSFTDYEIAERHGVSGKQIIDENGRMMANCGKYEGMTTLEAREVIVVDMEKMGLIDRIEDYENNLSVCYRCGHTIEPIPSKQWFIDVNKKFKFQGENLKEIKKGEEVSLKELMQKVVQNKQIEIIPERFEKTYFNWIDNLHDWCISRQIWYGHQIPVWYKEKKDGESEIYVGIDGPEDEGWQQDPDTLDTWFSSGLWTFSTLGYPDLNSKDLKDFHPTSVMETGYDILFFWVARMILMSTYVMGEIPFEKVYLHGLVRDEQGRKMSKSLDNVIDPLDTIKEYGADATRLSLLIGQTPGNDSKLSMEKIAGYRNFTNKLWNICRFMLINIDEPKKDIERPKGKTLADKWILDELNVVSFVYNQFIVQYNFSLAGEELRKFTWDSLANNYLEYAKIEGEKEEILNYILNTILKLWHPFMPFVTETIWQEIYGENEMLMVEHFEKVDTSDNFVEGSKIQEEFKKQNKDFLAVKSIVEKIRNVRAENGIEPAKKIDVKISAGDKKELLEQNSEIVKRHWTNVENLEIGENIENPGGWFEFVEGGVNVFIDLSGAIDMDRLKKEAENLEKYIIGVEKKLSNKQFVDNAPKEVVEGEKKKIEEAKVKLNKIKEQI